MGSDLEAIPFCVLLNLVLIISIVVSLLFFFFSFFFLLFLMWISSLPCVVLFEITQCTISLTSWKKISLVHQKIYVGALKLLLIASFSFDGGGQSSSLSLSLSVPGSLTIFFFYLHCMSIIQSEDFTAQLRLMSNFLNYDHLWQHIFTFVSTTYSSENCRMKVTTCWY